MEKVNVRRRKMYVKTGDILVRTVLDQVVQAKIISVFLDKLEFRVEVARGSLKLVEGLYY